MDSLSIALLLEKLNQLSGKHVKNIIPETKLSFAIDFKTFFLYVNVSPELNLISIFDEKPFSPGKNISLHDNLRSNLNKSKFISSSLINGDRIIKLKFEISRFGRSKINYLIIELMGKHSNIFVLDSDQMILTTLKMINQRIRNMTIGEKYMAINSRNSLETFSREKIKYYLTLEGNNRNNEILKEFNGLHHDLINDLFENFNEEEIKDYLSLLSSLYSTLNSEPLSPLPKFIQKRQYKINSTLFWKNKTFINIYDDVNEAFSNIAKDKFNREYYQKNSHIIFKKLKKLNSQKDKIILKLEEIKDYDKYRHLGDIFFARFNDIKIINSYKAEFYDFENNKIEISLDPRYDLRTNGKLIYKKYKKYKGTFLSSNERLEKLNLEIEKLNSLLKKLENGEKIPEFDKNKKRIQKKKSKSKKKENSSLYREFTSEDNHKIFVGKSSKGNDYVTSKLARSWDIWLHAKNVRGSHVVLRIDKNETPTDETIFEAAKLAAYYSKGKYASKIYVSVCKRQDIKKVKGTAGLVIINKEETVLVEFEKEN